MNIETSSNYLQMYVGMDFDLSRALTYSFCFSGLICNSRLDELRVGSTENTSKNLVL